MDVSSLLSFSEVRGVAVFAFRGSINLAESQPLARELRAHLRGKAYGQAFFRMDHVHYLDSSGLGLFVSLQHEFRGTTQFRFSGLRPNVKMVFEFSNLLNHFIFDDTWDDSWKSLALPKPVIPEKAQHPVEPKEFLAIEGKYILTEEGVRYCTQKQIPVKDIRLYRGTVAAGFNWLSVNPALLERFVTHGLLARVELERTEFLTKRTEILKLTTVLFDGIAMKRFRPLLKKKLLENDTYRELAAKGISPSQLRAAVREHTETIAGLKSEIEDLVLRRSPGTPRPKTAQLLALIDDSVWYLLTRRQASVANRTLRQLVLDGIVSYSGRLDLSESIALNLMEFLQQAERAHFQNLAEKDQFTRKHPQSIPELLADPSFRERLVAKAKLQNELLVMNMSFEGNPHGDLGLLVEITVRNKGTAGNASRTEALAKKSKGRKGSTLDEVLEETLSGLELEGSSLMNLNSLKEVCREQGIVVETSLEYDERLNETVASMRLVL